jgi:hypothetical protein
VGHTVSLISWRFDSHVFDLEKFTQLHV